MSTSIARILTLSQEIQSLVISNEAYDLDRFQELTQARQTIIEDFFLKEAPTLSPDSIREMIQEISRIDQETIVLIERKKQQLVSEHGRIEKTRAALLAYGEDYES